MSESKKKSYYTLVHIIQTCVQTHTIHTCIRVYTHKLYTTVFHQHTTHISKADIHTQTCTHKFTLRNSHTFTKHQQTFNSHYTFTTYTLNTHRFKHTHFKRTKMLTANTCLPPTFTTHQFFKHLQTQDTNINTQTHIHI